MNKGHLLIVAGLFVLVLAACYGLQQALPRLDNRALLIGNIIMALLTLFGFWMVSRTVGDRAQVFVRGVYSATFLKLMVCLIGVLAYALLNKATLYKPTLFALFGIYAVYTVVETIMMSQNARRVK